MYMTYEPRSSSMTASIVRACPALVVRIASETSRPFWAPVPVSVVLGPPGTDVVTLMRSLELSTPRLRFAAATTGLPAACAVPANASTATTAKAETAHLSHRTDRRGSHQPSI